MTSPYQTTTTAEFDAMVRAGMAVIPVVKVLPTHHHTPSSVYRGVADSRPGTFLLESAEQGGIWSRFSFVGVASFGVLTERDGDAHWIDTGLTARDAFGHDIPPAGLDAIDALVRRWKTPPLDNHPPMTGGLVGFIGWDAIRQIERLPNPPATEIPVPGQALIFVRDLIAFDHQEQCLALVTNVLVGSKTSFVEATARLDDLEMRMAQLHRPEADVQTVDVSSEPRHRTTKDDYIDAVHTAKEYIVAGDIFQVVISQRFELDVSVSALDIYRVLCALNPSPYMYLLNLEDASGTPYAVVGSSPEALVKVEEGRVYTHPIAGSRPRGETADHDDALANELLADAKERAEHLMLVDLARNDLLRVCRAGTVAVTEFMRIERFSHIMHIVSSVEGDLREDKNAVDVFRATFPAGTLSGAPKPRALEIIDELEPAGRGVYGGVVGYFDFAGNADIAIAIRTATIVNGVGYVQAGGGIVADSVPELEFQESVNKAAAPLRAMAIAQHVASDE